MKRPLAIVLLVALVVRVAVLLLWQGALGDDPDGYRELAENLYRHGTFGDGPDRPTAYRPPVYPVMLVPCVATGAWSRVAIGGLHVLLGLGTVALTYLIARRCTSPTRKPTDGVGGSGAVAVVASLLVAVDPILLVQSTQVMTETAATFLAILVIWLLACWCATGVPPVHLDDIDPDSHWRDATGTRWLVIGFALGLAALCRPVFLVWAALLTIVAAAGRRWSAAAAMLLGTAVVLAPWVARNWLVFDRPIIATTHGGYTLLLGNNPWFYDYLGEGRWTAWEADGFHRWWSERAGSEADATGVSPVPAGAAADELARDRLAYRHALRFIAEQPGVFAYSCLVRVGRLWSPLPLRDSPWRWAVAAWYAVEFALALIGAYVVYTSKSRVRQPAVISAVLLVLSLTAIHAFYWSNLRMRAPAVPVVAMAAAAGLAWLAGRNLLPDRHLRPRAENPEKPGNCP